METRLLHHPRLTVDLKTGSEGPKFDPYSYDEYTIGFGKETLVLHNGLAQWHKKNEDPKVDVTGPEYDTNWPNTMAKDFCGYTISELLRISSKVRARCPKGGFHELHSENGYPGEHFEVCGKCGNVVSSRFNISEVE